MTLQGYHAGATPPSKSYRRGAWWHAAVVAVGQFLQRSARRLVASSRWAGEGRETAHVLSSGHHGSCLGGAGADQAILALQ
jgi:hypothetical protein